VPWGGGAGFTNGFAALGVSLETSEPVPGGWRTRVNNASGAAQTFRVDVICANKPKGYEVAFASADNPPHTVHLFARVRRPAPGRGPGEVDYEITRADWQRRNAPNGV